jgi:hypothetical protein
VHSAVILCGSPPQGISKAVTLRLMVSLFWWHNFNAGLRVEVKRYRPLVSPPFFLTFIYNSPCEVYAEIYGCNKRYTLASCARLNLSNYANNVFEHTSIRSHRLPTLISFTKQISIWCDQHVKGFAPEASSQPILMHPAKH